MRSAFGGRSPRLATASATNSASEPKRSARLCSRSNAIVEEVLWSMPALPHIEPPRCPGQTSTLSGRSNSRSLSEW